MSFVFEAKVCFGECLGRAEGRRNWNAGVARRVGVLLAGMWSGCVVGQRQRFRLEGFGVLRFCYAGWRLEGSCVVCVVSRVRESGSR